MAEKKKKPLKVEGNVFLDVTEGGQTVEANSPVGITVDDVCVWNGRPEYPPVVDDTLEVRRFLRRAIYTTKPPPKPRPVRPVPKPTKSTTTPTVLKDGFFVCPQCSGTGMYGGKYADESGVCDLCEGEGQVSGAKAEAWADAHG